jgi:hypothetical protein
MRRLAPNDAMWHWFATKFPTDQFLVYAFAGTPRSAEGAAAEVLERARECADLRLRIRQHAISWRFPEWVPCEVKPEQVVIHALADPTWSACLDALARLSNEQLQPTRQTWRLHVFGGVHALPMQPGPATVVVLQISHALADGARSAALAGYLFGRATGPPAVTPQRAGPPIRRTIEAFRAQRQFVRDVEAGLVPPPKPRAPALSTNNRPTGSHILRTLVRHTADLPGPTITIGALVAVSEALSGYLRDRGEDVSKLTAEVPVPRPGQRHAYNHVGPIGVGLYPDIATRDERLQRIAADFEDWRRLRSHPASAAEELGFGALPAPLRRLGVWRLNPHRRSSTVLGNTVVSSVNRGAADLSFGGCPVLLTTGFPALSPMMGLAHGVHGIGDTVAISVNTTTSIVPDIENYLDRLNAALRR